MQKVPARVGMSQGTSLEEVWDQPPTKQTIGLVLGLWSSTLSFHLQEDLFFDCQLYPKYDARLLWFVRPLGLCSVHNHIPPPHTPTPTQPNPPRLNVPTLKGWPLQGGRDQVLQLRYLCPSSSRSLFLVILAVLPASIHGSLSIRRHGVGILIHRRRATVTVVAHSHTQ